MLHMLNFFAIGGYLCIYDDIKEFMELKKGLNDGIDRLVVHSNKQVLPYNYRGYLNRQQIGKNQSIDFIKNACKSENVVGIGVRDWIITHCTRATVDYAS